MNKKSAIVAGTWALTCGAAFLVGRTTSPTATGNQTENGSDLSLSSRSSNSRIGGNTDIQSPQAASGNRFRSSANPGNEEADIRNAVLALTRMKDPIARAEGFLQLVKDLSPDQFMTVIDAYRGEGISDEDFGEYRILLTAWANVAPLEALAYAKENTGSPFARQTILATWAKTDAAGAIAWARDNFDQTKNSDQANPWMVGVIEGLASTDLAQATRLLEELPYSQGRGEALGSLFDEIAQLGPEAGKAWIEGLSDPQLQAGAAARFAGSLAETDPEAAAQWASSLGPEAMKKAARSIADQWVNNDLNAAKSWVESQPQDVIAAAAPAVIEGILKQQDPAAASAWLSNYEGDPAFDDSVRTLIWRSMNETPELAADWIMKLSNDKDQERTFHRMLGGWMGKDPAGLADYVQNNPVPESIQGRVNMELQRKQQ